MWPIIPAATVCFAAIAILQRARARELSRAGQKTGQEPTSTKRRTKNESTMQGFLEFEDIRDGIIVLPGGRYRAVIEVIGTVNFPLLSDTEQENIESSFRTLLASVNFPLQFYTQTRQIDLSPQIRGIEERMATLPDNLRRYAYELSQYLAGWARYSPLVRRNYIVVQYDAGPGEDKFVLAKQELLRRTEMLGSELSKWLKWHRLTTDEIVELLYTALNKDRSSYARGQDAVEYGFFEPYVKGLRTSAVEKTEAA